MVSYDRRPKTASHATDILGLIVRKALDGRRIDTLIDAYVDEVTEDWEDENGPVPQSGVSEHKEWQQSTLGMLFPPDEAEAAFKAIYVPLYRRLVRGASEHEALSVMEMPDAFYQRPVPKAVVREVALASARRDAAEARALYERARQT